MAMNTGRTLYILSKKQSPKFKSFVICTDIDMSRRPETKIKTDISGLYK